MTNSQTVNEIIWLNTHLDGFISNALWWCTEAKCQRLCHCTNTYGPDGIYCFSSNNNNLLILLEFD